MIKAFPLCVEQYLLSLNTTEEPLPSLVCSLWHCTVVFGPLKGRSYPLTLSWVVQWAVLPGEGREAGEVNQGLIASASWRPSLYTHRVLLSSSLPSSLQVRLVLPCGSQHLVCTFANRSSIATLWETRIHLSPRACASRATQLSSPPPPFPPGLPKEDLLQSACQFLGGVYNACLGQKGREKRPWETCGA